MHKVIADTLEYIKDQISLYQVGKNMDNAEKMKMMYHGELDTGDTILNAINKELYMYWVDQFHMWSRIYQELEKGYAK